MISVRGNVRLSQANESSAVAINPICDSRLSKFSEPSQGMRLYNHDTLKQSNLENVLPSPFVPYSFPTHNHCTISAYGSTANPTSNHLASSLYVSQWRSVARWETNGADLASVIKNGTDAEAHAAMIQLIKMYRPPCQMNEMGLINPPIP